MKKFFAVILTVLMLITANVLASTYVGNVNSGKFHYSSCRWQKESVLTIEFISIQGKMR